jgi:hypothetical protein
MEFVSPDMYRKSAFRVLGVATSVSLREASKELERRRMLAELDQGNLASSPNRLELRPPPSSDDLRAAEAALHDPEKRLVHELFWFWPLDPHSRTPDLALQALQTGDLKSAAKYWETAKQAPGVTPFQIAIAKHNMAVRWHLFALDAEERTQGSCWNDEQNDIVQKAWTAAQAYWFDSIRSDAIWNALSARVIAINDERLSLEVVQSMRATIGRALLKVNASLALRYSETNLLAGAKAHLKLLLKGPVSAEQKFAFDTFLVDPMKARVRQRIADAEKALQAEPSEGLVQAQTLLAALSKYDPLLETLHDAGSESDLRGFYDEVAAQSLSCVIAFHNATGNDKDSIAVLEQTLPLAHSEELRSKIASNIATGKNNLLFVDLAPLIEPLKKIEESKDSPRERLAAFLRTVEPMIAEVNGVLAQSEALRTGTSDRIARLLRDISVDAWNSSKDGVTAIDALTRADAYAVSPEVKTQLATDRETLVQVYADQRRATRTATNKKYAWGVGIAAVVAILIAINLSDKPSGTSAERAAPNTTVTPTDAASSPTASSGQTYSIPSYVREEVNRDRAAAEQAQARVNGLQAQLAAAKATLEARQRDAESAKDEVDRLGASIDQERAFLDNTNEDAVHQFNAQVAKYNRLLKHAKALMAEADELVDPYNSLLARVQAESREADRLVDIYNNKLERYGRRQ